MTAELKTTIDELGAAFKEFKRTNDERLDRIEKGKGTVDWDAKLAKLDDELNKLEATKKAVEQVLAAAQRPDTVDEKRRGDERYGKAYGEFLRKGVEPGADTHTPYIKAVTAGTDASGGYAIPEGLETEIEKLELNAAPMRGIVRVISLGRAAFLKNVSTGGATSGWVGETAARPETNTPQLAQVAGVFGEIYANPSASQQSLDDIMFNVEEWLAEEVGNEFAYQEDVAIISGNGTNKPRGLLNPTFVATADATRTFGQVEKIETGVDGGFAASDPQNIFLDVIAAFKEQYLQNARWLMNVGTLTAARKFKDSTGQYIWQPGMTQGAPSILFGYPITIDANMPAYTTNNNLAVLFGDFKRAYYLFDVRGTRVLRDPYTNKPYVHFYTTKRVGGQVINTEAYKAIQFT